MIFYRLVTNRWIVIKALTLSLAIHILFLIALGNLGFEQKGERSNLTKEPIFEFRLISRPLLKNSLDQVNPADQKEKSLRNIVHQDNGRVRNNVSARNTELIQGKSRLEVSSAETIQPSNDMNNESDSASKNNTPTVNENSTKVPSLDIALLKSNLPKSSLSELASKQLQIERTTSASELTTKISSAKKEPCLKNQGVGLLGLPVLAYQIINDKCTFN